MELVKTLNGHENIDTNLFVKIKTGKRTRGHDFTLVKGQSRLDVRKYFLDTSDRHQTPLLLQSVHC